MLALGVLGTDVLAIELTLPVVLEGLEWTVAVLAQLMLDELNDNSDVFVCPLLMFEDRDVNVDCES